MTNNLKDINEQLIRKKVDSHMAPLTNGIFDFVQDYIINNFGGLNREESIKLIIESSLLYVSYIIEKIYLPLIKEDNKEESIEIILNQIRKAVKDN